MAMISNISWDLVEEILSRVPITCLGAVRTTCKPWNALSKDGILCDTDAVQQFLGFMVKEYRICSMRFDLHGIVNEEGEEFVDHPISIKEIGNLFNQVEISKIVYCEGLLLCISKEGDTRRLVVWNPYLGQTRWIQPLDNYHRLDRYALGYDNKNRNYKILRFLDDPLPYVNHKRYEIYDFSSDSWKVLDITPDWDIDSSQRGVSLKGNAYFFAKEKTRIEEMVGPVVTHGFLLCFDFTRERFGQFLPLPFQHYSVFDTRTLSSLRDEKLVALYQCEDLSEVEIWVSTRIEPNAVSWIPFLKLDLKPLLGFDFYFCPHASSFFIDEEKKLAVVFDLNRADKMMTNTRCCYYAAYIIGENGYLKKVHLGEAVPSRADQFCYPLVCSYVPCLVQID